MHRLQMANEYRAKSSAVRVILNLYKAYLQVKFFFLRVLLVLERLLALV